jgi:hypothetical protein
MYSFARRLQTNPAHARAAVASAVETIGRIRTITGREFTLWATVMSPDVGTLSASYLCKDLEDLSELGAKLGADDAFNDYVESQAGNFLGTPVDGLSQIVSGTPGTDPVEYLQVTQAVIANGSSQAAMAAGVEIAETAARITGTTTLFMAGITGPFGGVSWAGLAPDAATIQRANEALAADQKFQQLVDRSSPLYQGAGQATILRRLA